jgi:anti-sigma B factor antagonist
MAKLTLDVRSEGGVHVITCAGRITDGDEAALLRQQLDEAQRLTRYVVLDLSGVDFVDSCGLGVMARAVGRLRLDGGEMKLCGVPRHFEHVLVATRLRSLFTLHATAQEAMAAFATSRPPLTGIDAVATDILCVHPSRDVLVFVAALLNGAGFHATISSNVADAATLLRAAKPRLVVVAAELRGRAGTTAPTRFHQLLETLPLIELPADFATRDAAEAGEALLAEVRASLRMEGAGPPS